MKQAVAKFAIVYGASLSLLFGIALIPDHVVLIDAVEQRQEQAELRHRINVFAEGTWFLLSNVLLLGGVMMLKDKKDRQS